MCLMCAMFCVCVCCVYYKKLLALQSFPIKIIVKHIRCWRCCWISTVFIFFSSHRNYFCSLRSPRSSASIRALLNTIDFFRCFLRAIISAARYIMMVAHKFRCDISRFCALQSNGDLFIHPTVSLIISTQPTRITILARIPGFLDDICQIKRTKVEGMGLTGREF